jgi:hypothetical protein
VWNRIHAYGLGSSHGETVRLLLGRLRWLEMTPVVLARAGPMAGPHANAQRSASGFNRVSSGSRTGGEARELRWASTQRFASVVYSALHPLALADADFRNEIVTGFGAEQILLEDP